MENMQFLNQNEIEELIVKQDTDKYKPCRGNRVVIADGDRNILKSIKNIINNSNRYTVAAISENYKDTIEAVNEFKPDIVIMDTELTITNSEAVIKDILKNHPNIHIIMMSSKPYKALINKELKLGITDFIIKPIDKEILINALDKIPKEEIENIFTYNTPKPMKILTQQILEKTKLELIVEMWTVEKTEYKFFCQIWKDEKGIYTIVYIKSKKIDDSLYQQSNKDVIINSLHLYSTKDIVTHDISINDGQLIERLLSKGIFTQFSYCIDETNIIVLDGMVTYIKPYIYNDKNLYYGWQFEPKEKELKVIKDIIIKYIN